MVVHSEQYYFNESTGESTYEVPVTIEQTEMTLHYLHPNAQPEMTTMYVCKARAMIRSGCEMSSESIGVLEVGSVITALEESRDTNGTSRVRFERGWTSKTASNGQVVLEQVLLPQGWGTAVSRSTGDTYYVNEETGETAYELPGSEAVMEEHEGIPPA